MKFTGRRHPTRWTNFIKHCSTLGRHMLWRLGPFWTCWIRLKLGEFKWTQNNPTMSRANDPLRSHNKKTINNYTPEANNVESFAVASLTLLKTRGKSWTHLAKSRKLGSLYVYRKLTTHPPLSQHFALSEKYSKCLLRGGVGRQFPRNVKWSERKLNRVKDSLRKHPAWVYVTLRYGSKKFVTKHSQCIWIVFDKPRPLRPSAGRHQRL